jgi:hypothetical protein
VGLDLALQLGLFPLVWAWTAHCIKGWAHLRVPGPVIAFRAGTTGVGLDLALHLGLGPHV